MEKINDSLIEVKKKEKRATVTFYTVFFALILLVVVIFYLNVFVFMSVRVSGASMETTLQTGDFLIVNKKKKVNYGDIIIIDNVSSEYLVKRVIALGGDVLEIKEDGKVYLNGETLEENYLSEGQTTKIYNHEYNSYVLGYKKYVLGKDEVFYLGDNRLNSTDARAHGPCKLKDVAGVVEPWSVENRKTLTEIFEVPEKVWTWIVGLFGAKGCNG